MTMTVGKLKALLKIVPDDFQVHVEDVNFGGSYDPVLDFEIKVDADKRLLLLPGRAQQELD